MDWGTWSPILISVGVVSAAVAAIANVIVALMNNRRLRSIEKDKQLSEIEKYRYTNLYEMVLNWHKYDTNIVLENSDATSIATQQLINRFLDNIGRYNLIRPLLHTKYSAYISDIEIIIKEGYILLDQLVDDEITNRQDVMHEYGGCGERLGKILREVINKQLEDLILKDG